MYSVCIYIYIYIWCVLNCTICYVMYETYYLSLDQELLPLHLGLQRPGPRTQRRRPRRGDAADDRRQSPGGREGHGRRPEGDRGASILNVAL